MSRPSHYKRASAAKLTRRQREVLAFIADGHTNGEIAEILGISLDGIKWHVRELFGTLGVDSREEAAAWFRDAPQAHPGEHNPFGFALAGFWRITIGGGALTFAAAAAAVVYFHVSGARLFATPDDATRSPVAVSQTAIPVRTRLPSPLDGLSNDELLPKVQEIGAQEAATQLAFRAAFAASGAALDSLPPTFYSHDGLIDADITTAAARSVAIVAGSVTNQRLSMDGAVLSDFEIDQVLAGEIAATTVTVAQVGGPILQGNEAMLIEDPTDPILLDGTQYVLFLKKPINPAWSGLYSLSNIQYSVTYSVLALRIVQNGPATFEAGDEMTGLTIDQLRAKLIGLPVNTGG